ncbi:SLAM family member 9 [Carassius gibelio]|uniref:SLAM family member 9 n=1 Tax=Carassius gibelio TaxID=101364 RepID=UPI002278135C|nr:SLAM family member 9 [Carassius gibelio]
MSLSRKTFSFILCLQLIMNGMFDDKEKKKSLSVMEGDSVTLCTDVTKIQKNDLILWMYSINNSDTRIAEMYKQVISIYDNNEIFRNRLQMDYHSGSLTITNIRTEHSGLYKLTVIGGGVIYKSFTVNVHAHLPIPVILTNYPNCSSSSSGHSSVSNCSLLCSAVNVSAVTLSWYKGNSLLSSISVSDLSISLSLPLEVEYQEKNIYSCVINNPITNQTTHLENMKLCQTCSEQQRSYVTVPIVVGVMLVLIVAVPVGLKYCNSKTIQARQEGKYY